MNRHLNILRLHSWALGNAHVVLVTVAVATVIASLLISHEITTIHAEAMCDSKTWMQRTTDYVALQSLAADVHTASSRREPIHDWDEPQNRGASACAELESGLRSLSDTLAADPSPLAAEVHSDLRDIATSVGALIAGAPGPNAVADLDIELKNVNSAIRAVTSKIRDAMLASGDESLEAAERMATWQRRLAKVVVPLLLVLGGSGWGVTRGLGRATARARDSELQAKAALRRFEALRTTIDAHSIITVSDGRGRIIDANDAFCAISGYRREELLGQDHRIINSGTHPKEFWVQAWRTITSGTAWRGEVCNKAKCGTLYWVDSIIAPFTDAEGNIEQYVSIRHDITALKAAEARSRDALEFIRNALDSLDSHTVVLGSDGRIRTFNRAWAEFAHANGGAGGSVLEGADYLAECDRAAPQCDKAASVAAAIRAVLSGEASSSTIEYPCHAPHEKRWFLCSIRGFSLRNDRFAVVSHLNITAIKVAEQELTAANGALATAHQELEQRVLQRTAQLAEATEAAEAASHAKSEFLATMSHEIRTPLNGVVGTLDLLQSSAVSEQQRRYIQIGKTSALLLNSIINDILDFSKIEAGKLELCPVEFDLRSAIQEVMEMLAYKAAEKQLELVINIDFKLPSMVRGDADRLRQIVVNLVNNAIKFTNRGSITLRVSAIGASDDANQRIRFSVTDTGIGIPKERQNRLFKPFSQTDASFSRQFGGTGLGLAICKQLAELMAGTIGVESEPGRGSTFWFEIPLPSAEAPGNTDGARADEGCGHLRVLVIEDDGGQRHAIADTLRALRFQVETAECGEAALSKMLAAGTAGTQFAVVLTDLEMPGMDGFEVAVTMQSKPSLAGIPVILLSSAVDLDPVRVRAAGFAAHLVKPVAPSSLHDAIVATTTPSSLTTIRPDRPALDPGTAEPPVAAADVPGRPTRVLVVEDNEINQMIACELLSKSGFECTKAANGAAALAALAEHQFDLVLMDCQMPVMDGFDATREIRRLEESGGLSAQRGRLRIIALTANALKGDRERCLEAGMDGYASKPIDLKSLLATIESLRSSQAPVRAAA